MSVHPSGQPRAASAAAPSAGRGGGGVPTQQLPIAFDLRAERWSEPIGLDEPAPMLTWRVRLERPAARQASAAIEVASNPAFDPATVVWSRLAMAGPGTSIAYGGPSSASRDRRFWRVRITDDRGRTGPWSAPASWEMGLLAPDDWAGRWIGWIDGRAPSWSSRSPILRRSFRLPAAPVHGRAHVTALGLVELSINGRRVGTDRLAPGWTDYRQRIPYRTTDVLDHLRPGENVIGARLGRGWYAGEVAAFGAEQYGDFPALLAQVEVSLVDGRRVVVATDSSWRAHPGALIADDLLLGESVDARDEPAGWLEPGFADDDWRPVVVAAGPGGRLVAQRDAGAGIVAELEARAVTGLGPGRWIVDFGQNLAGHVRMRAAQEAGRTVTLRHAEALDADGELYTANLRTARQTDSWTFRGTAEEVFEPRFTTHGFRYVEISGLAGRLEPSQLTACAVSSMGPLIGSFACSDELVNAIHRNVVWGLRAGLLGIPVDCPQRDERLGWTADAAAMAPSALFLGDTAPFFEKWLIDLADAQLPSGAYPDVAPRIGVTGAGNAGWADAGILVPWLLYQRTGNARVIERQYDSMRRFLRFLEADQLGGVRHGGRYGDWLALEDPTGLELIGTAYLAHSADLFARMARLLGRLDDAAASRRLAARARSSFRRFLSPAGRLTAETQTGYALALGFGLVPPALRRAAADRLAELIAAADSHLLTGFLGTAVVLPVLSDHGHHELATRLARQDGYPSWGYEVRHGATTIWERWDSWTAERGFADPSMNSLNHAALGSVADWLHESLGGLSPGLPGYGTVLVRPRPVPGIDWARASHESRHGRHAVEWEADGPRLIVTIEVPANTFADLVVPSGWRVRAVDGRGRRHGASGSDGVGRPAGAPHLRLSWGRHVVELTGGGADDPGRARTASPR
ncbi:MAG TPA: family 78 glycoside hydrolase catalytic domain [Candidatus Limnocylindrales bacterium]|nr:family 78 glycoside hydrolase catalytic domain [Candidatus Limnocylindrales bacterium]